MSPILFPGEGSSNPLAEPYLSESMYRQILDIAPKVDWYEHGSGIGKTQAKLEAGNWQVQNTTEYPPGTNRLYATVDEILFRGSPVGGGVANSRPYNDAFNSKSVLQNFERARFCMTTTSNAPEITLFGTPRICLWPMKADSSQQTYYDRLIAYASTIGGRRYFWQKRNPGSRHGELYNTAGGANLALLEDYMVPLASLSIPGYGGSFMRKYGQGPFADGKEILVQIWDYMRNTNLNDPLLNPGWHYNERDLSQTGSSTLQLKEVGRGQIAGCCLCGGTTPHRTRWWRHFTPYPKGHGRNFTLSEACLVFHAIAASGSSGQLAGDFFIARTLDPNETLIEVGLLLETFCVAHGFTSILPKSRMAVVADVDTGSSDATLIYREADPLNPTLWPDFAILDPTKVEEDQELPWQRLGPLTGRNNISGNSLIPTVTTRWDPHEHYIGKRTWGAHGGVRLFSVDLDSTDTPNRRVSPPYDSFSHPLLTTEDMLVWASVTERNDSSLEIDPDRAIIVASDAPNLQFRLDSKRQMAVVLYDQVNRRHSSVNNLIQVFYLKWALPGKGETDQVITIPLPKVPTDGTPFRWKDRIRASGKAPHRLISEDSDVTRSLQVAHGDSS